MKAFLRYKYGGPETLQLEEIEKPTPKDDEILVHIKAISVNPAEWHRLRATPFFIRLAFGGLFKPNKKNLLLGSDFAGVVESVGKEIKDLKPGDEVFGEASFGSFGEFNCVKRNMIAIKPKNASFEEAACLGIAGLTALQGLRDHGNVNEGETVLINGASGGVGHYAIQIAKSLGAQVTAVCSGKNTEMVKSIGADHVIDYKTTDIHSMSEAYDLVLDVHGNLRYSDMKRLGKRGVLIGFTSMGLFMRKMLRKSFGKFSLKSFTAEAKADDLQYLTELYESEKLKTILDKTFPFEELPQAIAYIEKMHTSGKVAISH